LPWHGTIGQAVLLHSTTKIDAGSTRFLAVENAERDGVVQSKVPYIGKSRKKCSLPCRHQKFTNPADLVVPELGLEFDFEGARSTARILGENEILDTAGHEENDWRSTLRYLPCVLGT
jgi:hypothetical protein